MFKNQKLKKIISIICTILTLNFTSLILQCNPKAIELEHSDKSDEDDYCINYNKPFYYIIIRNNSNKQDIKNVFARSEPWRFAGLPSTATSGRNANTHALHCRDAAKNLNSFLEQLDKSAEIMLVFGLTEIEDSSSMPDLPYGMVACDHKTWYSKPEGQRKKDIDKIRKLVPKTNSKSFTLTLLHPSMDNDKYISCPTNPESDATEADFGSQQLAHNLCARTITVANLQEIIKQAQPPEPNKPNGKHLPATPPKHAADIRRKDLPPPKQHTNQNDLFEEPKDNLEETNEHPFENLANNERVETPDPLVLEIDPVTSPKSFGPASSEDSLNATTPPKKYRKHQSQNFITKTRKFINIHPKTSACIGIGIATFVATAISNVKKLFTRQSPKPQTKNNVNQKYDHSAKRQYKYNSTYI